MTTNYCLKLTIAFIASIFMFTACQKENDLLEVVDNNTIVKTSQAATSRNEEPCFVFTYPMTIILPEGNQVQVTNEEEMDEVFDTWDEENGEESEEYPTFKFPIKVKENGTTNEISNEEELEELFQRCDEEDQDGEEGDDEDQDGEEGDEDDQDGEEDDDEDQDEEEGDEDDQDGEEGDEEDQDGEEGDEDDQDGEEGDEDDQDEEEGDEDDQDGEEGDEDDQEDQDDEEDQDGDSTTIGEGNDPNFKIVANNSGELPAYSKMVDVFGVRIFAVPAVAENKLLHAANVLAQYLDNDEDGIVDNPTMVQTMQANNAHLVMWKTQADLDNAWLEDGIGQDLGNDETQPSFVSGGKTGIFDTALEEILHLITTAGYAKAYPDVFGERVGSELADAMDIARGGRFTSIPNNYPSNAWYSYDDATCNYGCMVAEYHYWALTSILGAQDYTGRLDEIGEEWRLNTRAKMQEIDKAAYQLLTDPTYNFPTVLPDGSYRQ